MHNQILNLHLVHSTIRSLNRQLRPRRQPAGLETTRSPLSYLKMSDQTANPYILLFN